MDNGFELVARYAANHPELFKNAVVAIFLVIQGFSMANNTEQLKRFKTAKTFKTARRLK